MEGQYSEINSHLPKQTSSVKRMQTKKDWHHDIILDSSAGFNEITSSGSAFAGLKPIVMFRSFHIVQFYIV
jgi:predicted metal-dependent HD superfamily phosphohydrolase